MEVVRTRVKGVYRKLVLEVTGESAGSPCLVRLNTCRLPRASLSRPSAVRVAILLSCTRRWQAGSVALR